MKCYSLVGIEINLCHGLEGGHSGVSSEWIMKSEFTLVCECLLEGVAS
jgi:hypothetical protein